MAPKTRGNNQRNVLDTLTTLAPELGGLQGLKAIANGDIVRAEEHGLRVEYINLLLVYPDPVQPRRILPDRIYQQFWENRLTQTQALRELIALAQIAARQNGRPFNSVTDFLTINEEEENNPTALTHEEQLVKDLVTLAATIRDDGQVNPLTVVDVSHGATIQYQIETGERRYWATWLLRDFFSGYNHDGKIPCIVVPSDKASVFRQAKENTARTGLNAIAMARQIALLLLAVHGYEMPMGAVTMDFYRQSLNLDLRDKREFTEAVYSALGGVSKRQLSGYKSLLRLCDEAIDIADRHNIEESLLRYVVQLENYQDQIELLQQIIQMGLTRKQVQEIVEKGYPGVTNLDEDDQIFRLPKSALQIAKLALKPDSELSASKLAQAFVGMERDKAVAMVRIQSLRQLLEAAERLIQDS